MSTQIEQPLLPHPGWFTIPTLHLYTQVLFLLILSSFPSHAAAADKEPKSREPELFSTERCENCNKKMLQLA